MLNCFKLSTHNTDKTFLVITTITMQKLRLKHNLQVKSYLSLQSKLKNPHLVSAIHHSELKTIGVLTEDINSKS